MNAELEGMAQIAPFSVNDLGPLIIALLPALNPSFGKLDLGTVAISSNRYVSAFLYRRTGKQCLQKKRTSGYIPKRSPQSKTR